MIVKVLLKNDFIVDLNITNNTNINDTKRLVAVILRLIGRKNICLKNLLNDYFGLKKCNNCQKYATYNLNYEIKIDNDILYFKILGIYYEKYLEYEKLYCNKCLPYLNGNSIEKVSIMYNISKEIAHEIILNRNKSPFYRNNYNSDEDYSNYQKRDLIWYKNKHGEELGEKIFRQNIKKFIDAGNTPEVNKLKDCMSINYFLKKCNGNLEEAKILKKERGKSVSVSLDNQIKRYGKEKGIEIYFATCKKLSYANTLEGYINRYGNEDGLLKYENWKRKCVVTIDLFINKYGEDEGTERYKKWLIGITKPFTKNFYSKESKNFFKKLEKMIDYKIRYAEDEKFIFDKIGYNDQHIFFYDGYIKELNLIIEYDTPTYHPNPFYLTTEEIKKLKYMGNYEKDVYKENLALTNGFKFYKIFIKTKKDRLIELEKLVNFINNL